MQLIRLAHLAPSVELQNVIVLIKPDAFFQRDLSTEIRNRFAKAGLKVLAERKKFKATAAQLTEHYVDHVGKPYFKNIISTMTAGPISAYLFRGVNAIAVAAEVVGATDPKLAAKGTIRGDFGVDIDKNTVYSSFSAQAYDRELKIWFPGFK